jgi:hypothetical protein
MQKYLIILVLGTAEIVQFPKSFAYCLLCPNDLFNPKFILGNILYYDFMLKEILTI